MAFAAGRFLSLLLVDFVSVVKVFFSVLGLSAPPHHGQFTLTAKNSGAVEIIKILPVFGPIFLKVPVQATLDCLKKFRFNNCGPRGLGYPVLFPLWDFFFVPIAVAFMDLALTDVVSISQHSPQRIYFEVFRLINSSVLVSATL